MLDSVEGTLYTHIILQPMRGAHVVLLPTSAGPVRGANIGGGQGGPPHAAWGRAGRDWAWRAVGGVGCTARIPPDWMPI